MRTLNQVVVAIPSMALGAFLMATLTTTASGQLVIGNESRPASAQFPRWGYKILPSETELNQWGAAGWEYCGESAYASSSTTSQSYTMRRRK